VQRSIAPELLDHLPASDPGALRSRRDLARVNLMMGNAAIVARALRGADRPRVLIDIGAGDGTFMLRLARRLAPRWPDCRLILLDRQNIVSDKTRAAFAGLSWKIETVATDVFDFFGAADGPKADVVTANLFLHHFGDLPLSRLLSLIAQRTPLFAACEPRRGAVARAGSQMLWAIGCNHVTLHDAAASVDAGFRGQELSALWPHANGWTLQERAAGLFSHGFVARRRAAA
jgi:hypothetical protein